MQIFFGIMHYAVNINIALYKFIIFLLFGLLYYRFQRAVNGSIKLLLIELKRPFYPPSLYANYAQQHDGKEGNYYGNRLVFHPQQI